VDKTYRFRCDPPIDGEAVRRMEAGVDIGDCVTQPASVCLYEGDGGTAGEITIREGKFHQIKRMFEACGSGITFLERIRFGNVALDETLARGAWRFLTPDEEKTLQNAVNRPDRTDTGDNQTGTV